MFSKIVEQRLQSVLNDSNREEFNAVIADSSKLETPEEELQFLLAYLNGMMGEDKKNAIVKLMGELLSSYLIFNNPSREYCQKLNTILKGYQSNVGNSPAYTEQLQQMRRNLSQQIKLRDTSEFKSTLLINMSLSACALITRGLLAKNKSLKGDYLDLMIEKLKNVSPIDLKKTLVLRQNYLILIKELKKANSANHLSSLEKLARPVVLMQIGDIVQEQVESNNKNISAIEKEIRNIEIPADIRINLENLKKYGKEVQELEAELKNIEKLLLEEKQKEQVHLKYFEEAEKIYSGEDLSNFKKLGEILLDKSLEAVKLSQSRYQQINSRIVEFSQRVAHLSSQAENENKVVNKKHEEIEQNYREFYSAQENALAQLEIVKAQHKERLNFLKENNLLDNSQDLDDAIKIFDELDGVNAAFEEAARKFKEVLRSFDPSKDLAEKREKIAKLSEELLKLSQRFQMQDTLLHLRKHLENLSQQVNSSIEKTKVAQASLLKESESAKSEQQEIEKKVETCEEEIKRLSTKQDENWKDLKSSLQNQISAIDSKASTIQLVSKSNREKIDSLGTSIFWYGLPIIRWFFGDRLKACQTERETLLDTNKKLGNLESSLQAIKKEAKEIASSEAPITDFISLQGAYSGLKNLQQQNDSLRQYIPDLIFIEETQYVKVLEQISEHTKERETLGDELERTETVVEDFTRRVSETQKKIVLLESDKVRTFTELLIEAHGKEKEGIDLTQMGNKKFLLHLQSSAETGNLDQIKLIIEHCTHLNAPNSNGNNALHFAAHKGEVGTAKLLLSNNELWHSKNKDGNTPLHFAALGNKPEIVKLLLDNLKDQNSNFKNHKGNTPLHIAVSKGNLGIVDLLLSDLKTKNLEWNLPNTSGYTPLDSAVFQGKVMVVNLLIDDLIRRNAHTQATVQFNNLLFIAYKKYSEAEEPNKREKRNSFELIIQRLKEEGARFDLSKQDHAGNNIFHLAAKNGDIHRIKELTNQDKSLLSQFVSNPIDFFVSNPINKENAEGKTPLQLALENDHLHAVRLLILSGANVDKQTFATEKGKQFLAEISSIENKEIYPIFVKEGLITSPTQKALGSSELAEKTSTVDGNAELAEDNDEPNTQEILAKERLEKERLAREREVSVQNKIKDIGSMDFNDKRVRDALIGEIKSAPLQVKSRLANAKDKNGNNLLHVLINNKEEKAVKEVCQYADVYIKDRSNKSALTLATESFQEENGSLMGVLGSLAGKRNDDVKEAKIYKAVEEKARKQDSVQLKSLKIMFEMRLVIQQLLPKHKSLILALKIKKVEIGKLELINKRVRENADKVFNEMQETKHKTENRIIRPLTSQEVVKLQLEMMGLIEILKEDIASMEVQLKSRRDAEKYQWHSSEQDTPLHQDIKRGEIDIWSQRRNAEALAENINKMSGGYPPLHLAILYAKSSDSQEEQETSLHMAKFLIEKGADINAKNTKGETTLHLLAQRSDPAALEIMKLLKGRQVQTETVDNDGNNARQIATREKNQNFLNLFSTRCEEFIKKGITFFAAPEQESTRVASKMKTEVVPVFVDKTNLFKQIRKKKQEEQQHQQETTKLSG
ncbi:ankyrin repeat domain-containing protein [Legionella sp. WA2022007384]